MAFSSLNEFFAMGGHAVYVWAAWGVTALLMLIIVWHARQERRQLLHAVKRRVRRENAQRQSPHGHSPQAPITSAQKDGHHDAET